MQPDGNNTLFLSIRLWDQNKAKVSLPKISMNSKNTKKKPDKKSVPKHKIIAFFLFRSKAHQ